ncbi:MAG: hypothetical protein HS132_16605 [Planctomycetia bacterium]|nr:hypothetical protein [Planctomycetia bacterium]
MSNVFGTPEIAALLTLVEEAARSTEAGVKHFVEPAPGTLSRTINKRHHIVFGRRGSGKSSLLQKAAADLTVDRRPIAYVNLEAFKGHSYPDVLISVLISTLGEFKKWMDSAAIHPASRTSFWKRFFGTTPQRSSFNRRNTATLSNQISKYIDSLEKELHSVDEAEMSVTVGAETSEKDTLELKVGAQSGVGSMGASANAESSSMRKRKVEETFKRSKVDFLHRHIIDYQRLFNSLAQLSDGDAYLFLDDLYHIRRGDQARVVDYFHRLAKDHHLWLKVGTIRHRTRWYVHGDPPVGMKIADDADEIDLDLTLEKYSLAKAFLVKILKNFAESAKVGRLDAFLTDRALDRLVLACGGVARDFLSIFRRSVDVARGHRGDKVSVEDVNVAAGEYDSAKREDFRRDTLDDSTPLEEEFINIRQFCLEHNNTNCFLLDKEQQGREVDLIHELVDLKLVHLIRSRVTVSGRPGRIYEAYMLDLSQYAGARKRRRLELVEFWRPDSAKDALRRISLLYTPGKIVEQTAPGDA